MRRETRFQREIFPEVSGMGSLRSLGLLLFFMKVWDDPLKNFMLSTKIPCRTATPITADSWLVFRDDLWVKVFLGTIFCGWQHIFPMPGRILHSYTFEMGGEHGNRTGRYEQEKLSQLTRDTQSSREALFATKCTQCSLGGSRMKTIHPYRVYLHYLCPVWRGRVENHSWTQAKPQWQKISHR